MDTIRLATEDDAAACLSIYAPIVRDTVISFEVQAPSLEEMRARVHKTLAQWPWLVATRGGAVLGYAYASQHRERAAYQWSADVSVYVHREARRQGLGRRLYGVLLGALRLQGYCNAYAGITLPNAQSVGLHEALGFVPVGVYRGVGWKLGAWHDVGWWQRALGARPESPAPPLPLAEVRRDPAWERLLAGGA